MTATPHPYAEILRAIADGQPVQFQQPGGRWAVQSDAITLSEISSCEYSPAFYRVAPRTITINGHTVPEPLQVEPPDGTPYWVPAILSPQGKNTSSRLWAGSDNCNRWLRQGLVHLTKEAAEAHAQALISITDTQL